MPEPEQSAVTIQPQLEASWKSALQSEFEKPYFREIKRFILDQKRQGKEIYPPGPEIFNAFAHTPFDQVKVVILGQDPYHGPGQAHGLCFSVRPGVPPPPSLVNIFKEIESDLNTSVDQKQGDLSSWADQGVLLLNAILTVNAREAASHRKAGWERFTNAVIEQLSQKREHLVFLLWGRFAQNKAHFIQADKHLILKAAHPSPLSAYNGFHGCRHFSKTNSYLEKHGKTPIRWQR
jgi:uracil-DNA glycosylase